MTYDDARLLLLMHGPGTEDAEGQPLLVEDGFLCSLRPYRGLVERNFHVVTEALLTLGETLHRSPQVDRTIVHAVWSMCSTAYGWGLRPDGMLQRNKLISADDSKRLERWIDTIEVSALNMLCGHPPHYRIYLYAQYVIDFTGWENIDFFIGLMERAIADPDLLEPEICATALGKQGRRARRSLPILHEALARNYTYSTPHERCTEKVRGVIRQAIDSIEASPP